MSQPVPESSADIVRSQFAAFRTGLDAVSEFWDPDIAWRAVEGAADDAGVIHGGGRLRRYYEDWIGTFEEIHAEVEEVLFDSPDRCAVVVRNSGRASGSSALIQGRYYVVCTVRDGLIVSGREYETEAEALVAVGSSH